MDGLIIPGGNTGIGGTGGVGGTQGSGGTTGTGGTGGTGNTGNDSSSSGGGSTGSTTPSADQPVITPQNTEGLNFSMLMMVTDSALNTARKQRIADSRDNSIYVVNVDKSSITIENNDGSGHKPNSNAPASSSVTITLTSVKTDQITTAPDTTSILTLNQKKVQVLVPPQFLNSVQAYVDGATRDNPQVVLPAALSLANENGTFSGYNSITPAQADAASAVAWQEYSMNLVDVGSSKTFATTQFPNDPTAAANASALMDTQVLNQSAIGLGQALGMPGLQNQLQLQAQLQLNVVNSFNSVSNVDSFVNSLDITSISEKAGITPDATKALIEKAITDTTTDGTTYLTSDSFFQAVNKNLEQGFPGDNADVVAALVGSGLKTQAFNLALGSDYASSTFDVTAINIETAQNTLSQAILTNWGDNIDEVNQENYAASISKQVLDDVLKGQYQNAQQVRTAIQNDLVKDLGMDSTEAANIAPTIAASVDLGLPKTGPLYDPNSTVTMSPADFAAAYEEGYTSQLHVAPDSDFASALNHAAGISATENETNLVGLYNQAYVSADQDTRNFLNLPADEAESLRETKANYTTYAPVVLQWGSVVNGGNPPPNAQKTISINV
jgi:hypothetical protein